MLKVVDKLAMVTHRSPSLGDVKGQPNIPAMVLFPRKD